MSKIPHIKIEDRKIQIVLKKTSGVCFYCGRPLEKDTEIKDWSGKVCSFRRNWEVDHVMPVSKGGTNNIYNLVPSCVSCNRKKGAK